MSTDERIPPPASAEDDVGRFMAEKRLVDRLEEVRHNMAERVSDGAARVKSRTSELVVNAMGFLGVPYRRGGSSAETGFDCSGFVKAMYEQTLGQILPRRVSGFKREWLDDVTLSGEFAWGRLWGSAGSAVRVTPITFVPRDDLHDFEADAHAFEPYRAAPYVAEMLLTMRGSPSVARAGEMDEPGLIAWSAPARETRDCEIRIRSAIALCRRPRVW